MVFRRKTAHFGVVALMILAAYGCTISDGPTAPAAAPSHSLLGSLTGTLTTTLTSTVNTITGIAQNLLLRCDALPEATVTRVIGRGGGTINVGPHTLVIPARALSRDTRITAHLPGDNVSSVQLYPEGLRFSRPASLTLSYAHCRKLLPLPIQVVYTTDDLAILELLKSRDDPKAKKVRAPLDHFSRYAAAWRSSGPDDDEQIEGLYEGEDGTSSTGEAR
jgi:hypothetical protein